MPPNYGNPADPHPATNWFFVTIKVLLPSTWVLVVASSSGWRCQHPLHRPRVADLFRNVRFRPIAVIRLERSSHLRHATE